jgi:drug/metabolite transporter (DMT)-like permease
MFLVLTLYALFASVFTISKTGLEYSQPLFLIGTRMLLAGVILLAYQFIKDPGQFKLNKKDLWLMAKLALFNIYLTNAFEFWGLEKLSSFKSCFFYSLSPFFAALFSYFVFSERLSKNKWLGLMLGFLGFIPLLMTGDSGEMASDTLYSFSWAEASAISAAVCSVYGWILLKQLVDTRNCSPVMANGMSMIIGGAFALGHSYMSENWSPVPVTEFAPFIAVTLSLIVISNMICYNLYGHLLKSFSATFMSFAGFTTPLFSALFGWFFLGEIVGWPFFMSAAIVFMGLFIFQRDELKTEIPAPEVSTQ